MKLSLSFSFTSLSPYIRTSKDKNLDGPSIGNGNAPFWHCVVLVCLFAMLVDVALHLSSGFRCVGMRLFVLALCIVGTFGADFVRPQQCSSLKYTCAKAEQR